LSQQHGTCYRGKVYNINEVNVITEYNAYFLGFQLHQTYKSNIIIININLLRQVKFVMSTENMPSLQETTTESRGRDAGIARFVNFFKGSRQW